MTRQIRNLVFEGGGVWGISYLGVLDYLHQNNWMSSVSRVAGTSAGAITACITSFNLPFTSIKEIVSSLDYKKVPMRSEFNQLDWIPKDVKKFIDDLFGDMNCLYRLVNNYGWFSTDYFYSWIKDVIAAQFDKGKKRPPYTFADFRNTPLHKGQLPFYDLYIIGTNLSMKTYEVFSYETTPDMEVAEAVRISMSIPLIFEAVKDEVRDVYGNSLTNVFCDGGVMNNYPLTLFDGAVYNTFPYYGINLDTLGVRFISRLIHTNITNLLEYIESLLHISTYIQQENYESNPLNKERSIVIDPYNINPINFNISTGDETYEFLYKQGYEGAMNFFNK
ncbi:MAG: Patatin [Anaerocolumna sp.]|nr:Patatin [Anaerocolumna sp.]